MLRVVSYVALCAALGASGYAHAGKEHPGKPTVTVQMQVDDAANDADRATVMEGWAMIRAGKIQAAIDGPFNQVVNKYEAKYGNQAGKTVFCARTMEDGLLYSSSALVADSKSSVTVLGPAWAMAYGGRAYAYNEMNRPDDARVELEKAIALSPRETEYKSELAYVYQIKRDFESSLRLYNEALADAEIIASDPVKSKCIAYRGSGYALVELGRLDEAVKAYEGCLKIKPGEPKSTGELGYIRDLRAKAK
ncbi:tetratricopeptide (TPR) repeat protein [Luteibacter sp. Sphag1AF]|uniref:tetratricopeptide repeat protein n=1 Tax=Luteibacter sp. Sphag1AF TaxID=2587031 RepID=UPI001607677D|nr:tetratricopeptide repeat protein [Luteibacter sp. Sphag1AF]MBB3227986.1 tetratricopeptide (TPR) repeat protein [Luteibacter sp. Sphag1AF]